MARSSQTSDPASITATAGATGSTVASEGARAPLAGAPAPTPKSSEPSSSSSSEPSEAEGYRVIDELGRGGMGRVMRAEDVRLRREVAVKQLVSRTAASRARFEREAHITARLQHPAIVPVYEARLDAQGAPFYAMKLVTGRTLAEVIRSTKTLVERMGLLRHVVAVADAMAYAHSRRVIHRDLKASNVVVGEFGETIVIDWGLAKDLAATDDPISDEAGPLPGSGDLTQDGAIMGTPAYMPPEQAEGDPVDERADVYALGVMLYHVIAGEMPYSGASSADVLAAVLAGPPRPLLERVPAVPRDLAAIVTKAMAREPARRYPSARELAGELSRFQTGQLVGAHEYTTRELVARWVRRHRAAVAVGAVALVTAAVGGGLAVRSVVLAGKTAETARRAAVHERDQAEAARRDAVRRADEAIINRARDMADDSPGGSIFLLNQLSKGTPQLDTARVIAADALAHAPDHMIGQMGSQGRRLAVAADGVVRAASQESGLWWRPDGGMGISKQTAPAVAVDGSASAWLEDGRAMVSTETPPDNPRAVDVPAGTRALAVTPGGSALFAMVGDRVFHIDVASGERRDLGVTPTGVFPPELVTHTWLYTAGGITRGQEFALRAWRADGREVIGPGVPLASSRDGSKTLFLDGRRLLVRDAKGDTFIATTSTGMVGGSFDDSGRWLAWSQYRDERVYLRDLSNGRTTALDAHTETSIARAFSRDGHLLATGGNDGHIKIWDLRVLAEERPEPLESVGPTLSIDATDTVIDLGFIGDGDEIVAVMGQGLVVRWDLPEIAWTPRFTTVSHDLSWSGYVHEGVAHARRAGETEVRRLERVSRTGDSNDLLVFSRDGAVAAVAGVRELIRWEPHTATSQRHPVDGEIRAVAIAPAGDRLAALTVDGSLWLLDTSASAAPRRLAERVAGRSPEFSPDGAHIALRGDTAIVLRVADGASLTLAPGDHATFSLDGREVAITGGDKASRCELATSRCEELKFSFKTAHPAFGPNGELSAVRRGLEIVEWAPGKSGIEPKEVGRHRAAVNEITYSPDGRSLVTCGQGPEVQLIDRASGEYRLLDGIHDHPYDARFVDGKVLVADWFRVYAFDDSLPRDEAGLRAVIAPR